MKDMKKVREFLKEASRDLRKNMTEHERKLWFLYLRDYPVRIHRQKVIGMYIVDFYCALAKVAIEIDGSQHYTEEGILNDTYRTDVLEGEGIKVIRFTNKEVDNDFNHVCKSIDAAIKERLVP